jgi:hypothetical protein
MKKLFILAFVASSFVLVSCGSKESETAKADSVVTPAADTTPVAAPDTTPVAAPDTVKPATDKK